MSGVYIKGMDIPTRCEDCFCYRNNAEYDYAYCNISSVKVLGNANARLNNCPLIPVPDHGRLIDADAFAMEVINSFMDCADLFDNANSLAKAAEITDAFVRDINEAPTIIPADKEGEG